MERLRALTTPLSLSAATTKGLAGLAWRDTLTRAPTGGEMEALGEAVTDGVALGRQALPPPVQPRVTLLDT